MSNSLMRNTPNRNYAGKAKDVDKLKEKTIDIVNTAIGNNNDIFQTIFVYVFDINDGEYHFTYRIIREKFSKESLNEYYNDTNNAIQTVAATLGITIPPIHDEHTLDNAFGLLAPYIAASLELRQTILQMLFTLSHPRYTTYACIESSNIVYPLYFSSGSNMGFYMPVYIEFDTNDTPVLKSIINIDAINQYLANTLTSISISTFLFNS